MYFEWGFSPLCFFEGECGLGLVSFTNPLSSEAGNLSRLGCVTESDHDCDNMAELTMVMVIKMMMMTLLLKIHSCE